MGSLVKRLLSYFGGKRPADDSPDVHQSQHASSSSQVARTVVGEERLAVLPPKPDPSMCSRWGANQWAELPVRAWSDAHPGESPLVYAIGGKLSSAASLLPRVVIPGRVAGSFATGARWMLKLQWIQDMMAQNFPDVVTMKHWKEWLRAYGSSASGKDGTFAVQMDTLYAGLD